MELLNLWGPQSFPTEPAQPCPMRGTAGPRSPPPSPGPAQGPSILRVQGSSGVTCPTVPMKPKPHLLVESSSSESKKLVVSNSLLIRVDELSYPPGSRRRSPFTVPFSRVAAGDGGSWVHRCRREGGERKEQGLHWGQVYPELRK